MSTSHGDPGHDHDARVGPGQLKEVSDGVFAWIQPDGSWWINNCGTLVGTDGVVSIDTCATERRTRAYLDAVANVTSAPIRTVVNTHHHGDHTHGNGLLPNATIIAQHRCRELVLASGIHSYEGVFSPVDWGTLRLNAPFVTFDDALTVWVDQPSGALEVQLRAALGPAHTTNDVVAFLPQRKLLFAGDLVFNGGTPFVLMGSVTGALASIDWLRSIGAETIVPGHGEVCTPAALDGIAAYYRFVLATAEAGRKAGWSPLETARSTDLGEFSDLLDSERIVGNLHRAYAEMDGAAPGATIDVVAAIGDMVIFNGGRPLRCLA